MSNPPSCLNAIPQRGLEFFTDIVPNGRRDPSAARAFRNGHLSCLRLCDHYFGLETSMMPTRWILVGMQGFALAAVAGLALGLLGPLPVARTLGWSGFALATVGTLWHAYLLRRLDPHAWSVVRYRIAAAVARAGTRWSRVRNALARTARGATAANP